MAELFVKHWPVGPDFAWPSGAPCYILEMDEYEFRNLRWMMDLLYRGKGPPEGSFNTGDWLGQIRHALVEGVTKLPYQVDLRPNVGEVP